MKQLCARAMLNRKLLLSCNDSINNHCQHVYYTTVASSGDIAGIAALVLLNLTVRGRAVIRNN